MATKITALPSLAFGDDADTGLYYANSSNVKIATGGISLDPTLLDKIEKMEKNLENVMKRLSVLDEPNPEQLEKHKMLKEAYEKYKFIEELCGKDES